MLAPIAAALTALVLSPPSRSAAAHGRWRCEEPAMKILRWQPGASAAATQAALQGLIESGRTTAAVFVLHFTEGDVMSNSVVERTIERYEASHMYDGPPLACAQIVRLGDGGPQDDVCSALSIASFPTTQVWRRGDLVEETSAYELETLLLSLGLRSAQNRANLATREDARAIPADDAKQRGRGSGLPDADAVDEIDFTGGGGYGGRPDQKKQQYGGWKDRGTTADFFPFDPDEKPGDQMGNGRPGKR